MIVLFHSLSILILEWLEKRKRRKCCRELDVDQLFSEVNESPVDVDVTLKFSPPVYKERYYTVFTTLLDPRWRTKVTSLVDFGSAELRLLSVLEYLNKFRKMYFVDIDEAKLSNYSHQVPCPFYTQGGSRKRLEPLELGIFAGSIADPDWNVRNMDVVTGIEVIEHLYPDVLEAVPYNIFKYIQPKLAIFTTPNADFNVLFFGNTKQFRHYDHKFEWSREQFQDWANNITVRFPDYIVNFSGVGPGPSGTQHLGHCSQIATFIRKDLIDDEYVMSPQLSCICDKNSACKTSVEKNLLESVCKCVCDNCVPLASYGICTYYSCSEPGFTYHLDKTERTILQEYYRLIKKADYDIPDGPNEEETLLERIAKRLSPRYPECTRFYEVARKRFEIPIVYLTYGEINIHMLEPDVVKLLHEAGYKTEECLPEDAYLSKYMLVYDYEAPADDMEKVSNSSEPSGYDSDFENYQLNEEFVSDWNDPYVNEENEEPCKDCTGYVEDENSFPHWLLQILGSQVIVEGDVPAGSQEEPHFYCQGDGLGVHPSVIAVEIDDEEDTTDSTNNTAEFADLDQGPSSQDTSSLPEDSQVNPLEASEPEPPLPVPVTATTPPAAESHDFLESNSNADVGASGST